MSAEVYVSTDVETDGPIPGPHSMLSLASAAFRADGTMLGTYSANLLLLEGAAPHPETEEFWRDNPDAYAQTRIHPRPPAEVMPEYRRWVADLPGKPVFAGYPVTYDFMWVFWYLHRFAGESPFSHSAVDMKTMAMLLLGTGFRASTKRHWPARWFPENTPTPTSPSTTPSSRAASSAPCSPRRAPGWEARGSRRGHGSRSGVRVCQVRPPSRVR